MLLLLACTDAAPPPELDDVPWDALLTTEFPDWVTPRSGARPRFTDGGDPVAEGWVTADALPVVTIEKGVQYRWTSGGLALLFWVDRADLEDAHAVDAWIGPGGEPVEDGGPGLWVTPGKPIEDGGVASFVWPIEVSVPARPWVEGVDWPVAEPPPQASGEAVLVSGELTDDDGVPFATLRWDMEAIAVEETDGAVFVEVRARRACSRDTLVVRGWADPAEVHPGGNGLTWSSYCCGFGRWPWQPVEGDPAVVAEGSLVWDAPGGVVIGRAFQDNVVALADDEVEVDGLRAIRVKTGLGVTTVWTEVTDWDPEAFVEASSRSGFASW